MGRGRIAAPLGVALVAVLLVGCSAQDGSGPTATSEEAARTIALRDPSPVDTGVITSFVEAPMPESTAVELSPSGLTAALVACHQVGIGQWRWEGTITLPHGIEEATVELRFVEIWSDGPWDRSDWTITATVDGSGTFTIERAQDVSAIDPDDPVVVDIGLDASSFQADVRDRFASCGLRVVRADVPIVTTTAGDELVATRASDPIAVDAEESTIDALANGAHLGDLSDGRLPFAYLVAHQQPLPFDTVVVPDVDEVPIEAIFWWAPTNGRDCPLVRLVGQVIIEQTDDCTDPPEQGDDRTRDGAGTASGSLEPPSEAPPGWEWLIGGHDGRYLRGRVDGWWVQLSAREPAASTDAELVAIARTLHAVRNERVAEVVPRRDTGPDLDVIVDDLLEVANGTMSRPWATMTERARFRIGADWLLLFERRGDTAEWWGIEVWRARPHALGWRAEPMTNLVTDNGVFMPPPHAYCVGALAPFRDEQRPSATTSTDAGAGTAPPEVVVARERSWTIEAADEPGRWRPLDTADGVWLGVDGRGERVDRPPLLRAIDEKGRPVEGAVAVEHGCLP